MSKPMLRTGPRIAIIFDFNLQWLWPKVHGSGNLWYVHLGWFSWLIAFGKARDTFFDVLEGNLYK